MCAGVAVIGADRGGIPYMVQDRITGLVCPAEHAAALAGALACIGRDPALAQQMGRAGYARAREEFTWSNTGDRLARAMTHRLAEAAGG
jgi:starch synthase